MWRTGFMDIYMYYCRPTPYVEHPSQEPGPLTGLSLLVPELGGFYLPFRGQKV